MATSRQEIIGRYRILNIVATSRTARIAEAMHDVRQRRVALKILLPEYTSDKNQIALFKHEYAVGHGIKHKRIIGIHEFVARRDLVYLTMEFFPDRNLKQAIRQGTGRMAHLIPKIIEQAAEGLAHFHSQSWIHRDIKPDNFLINGSGQVKLIDFALAQRPKGGLARLIGGKSKIQGTRTYMAPEPIERKNLTPQTDVYAFGCSMFELMHGKPPYTGTNSNELLSKHLKAPIPVLNRSQTNVTQEFSQLVQRTMAKSPADRPDGMEEFLKEFRDLKVFERPPQPPADEIEAE